MTPAAEENSGRPLILTLRLDDAAQLFYEDLRRRWFPPDRNLIAAHLTLFHQLPDDESTRQTLRDAAQAAGIFPLRGPELRSIGHGVAVFFQSEDLGTLHASLSRAFENDLTQQDRQRIRPHIVVQNKVDAATARATLAKLQPLRFAEAQATGFSLWRYLGGPWEHLADLPFEGPASRARGETAGD